MINCGRFWIELKPATKGNGVCVCVCVCVGGGGGGRLQSTLHILPLTYCTSCTPIWLNISLQNEDHVIKQLYWVWPLVLEYWVTSDLFQHKKALVPLGLFPCERRGSGHETLKSSNPFLVLCPARPYLLTRNGLVNEVKFLGLIPKKKGKDQWDWEIANYYVALPLQK